MIFVQVLCKYYKSYINATNIPWQMSVTDLYENEAFNGMEYENKNCNEISSENSKRIKKAKFQEHF